MEAALALRSRCLASEQVSFWAEVRADYITTVEEFSLACETDREGTMAFQVLEPEEIAGIRGAVREDAGTMEFEETVLAFPLMAGTLVKVEKIEGVKVFVTPVREEASV